MALSQLTDAWRSSSLVLRISLIAGVILLFSLLLIPFGLWRDHVHDRRFDASQTKADAARDALAQENQQLRTERDELIGKAKAAEARAADAEARGALLEIAVNASSSRVRDANERLVAEDTRYAESLAEANSGDFNPCDRWLRNCAAAKRLGLKRAAEPCECQ